MLSEKSQTSKMSSGKDQLIKRSTPDTKSVWASPSWNTKTINQYFRPKKIINETFHESVGPFLLLGQIFSLFPVVGIFGEVDRLRFKFYSFRNIYALVFIVAGLFEMCMAVRLLMSKKFDVSTASSMFFYGISMSGAIFLYILSYDWRNLMLYWREKEEIFLREPYRMASSRFGMKRKIQFYAFGLMLLAGIEHGLYIISTVNYDITQVKTCRLNITNLPRFIITKERPHAFQVFPYHWTVILFLEWLNITMTFCWNYIDVFIIVLSIGITTRFEQFFDRINVGNVNKIMPESYWMEVRQHFIQLVKLLNRIDERISLIILLSCSTNLYHICYQLFNSIGLATTILLTRIYFFYSLAFIILRTLCVLYFASSIHDMAMRPKRILRDVPSASYTLEVQRFTHMLNVECIALTGRKFFNLTRRVILVMAGTVITYELVLLDQLTQEPEKKSMCNITRPVLQD